MITVGLSLGSNLPLGAVAPRLPIGCYRLLFACDPALAPAGYSGSAWRGAFGHALKRTVCVTHERYCPNCFLYHSCLYPYIFETPPPPHAAKMRRYNAAPHPFVLEPPGAAESLDSHGRYPLGLTLFGQANRYLPYLAHALREAGNDGLGARRVPLYLMEIQQQAVPAHESRWQPIHSSDGPLEALPPEVPPIPPLPAAIGLTFCTPLRVKRGEELVGPDEFCFADLFAGLLRRISLLTYFHTDTPLETDFKALIALAREISIQAADLHWCEWTRYSSRQQTALQMGGLLGEIGLQTAGIEPLWPYLWLGQWTHAGKGTSMGLGRYAIRGAPSLPGTTTG